MQEKTKHLHLSLFCIKKEIRQCEFIVRTRRGNSMMLGGARHSRDGASRGCPRTVKGLRRGGSQYHDCGGETRRRGPSSRVGLDSTVARVRVVGTRQSAADSRSRSLIARASLRWRVLGPSERRRTVIRCC